MPEYDLFNSKKLDNIAEEDKYRLAEQYYNWQMNNPKKATALNIGLDLMALGTVGLGIRAPFFLTDAAVGATKGLGKGLVRGTFKYFSKPHRDAIRQTTKRTTKSLEDMMESKPIATIRDIYNRAKSITHSPEVTYGFGIPAMSIRAVNGNYEPNVNGTILSNIYDGKGKRLSDETLNAFDATGLTNWFAPMPPFLLYDNPTFKYLDVKDEAEKILGEDIENPIIKRWENQGN